MERSKVSRGAAELQPSGGYRGAVLAMLGNNALVEFRINLTRGHYPADEIVTGTA